MRPFKTLQKLYDEESQVVITEKGSPPRVLFHGENFLQEDLPVGTRVIFPRPPLAGVPNVKAAIRYAINNPEGMEPLHALLKPGMRLTCVIDDISVPLPPMVTPDVRQTILEIVLELAADSGVDDIHLVIANALHRRMTEGEMKRMVGEKIFDAYYPDRYYNHDAEDPDGMVALERTSHGEEVSVNRRVAESDLIVYVNVNFVPMNGGHKSMGTGVSNYASLRHHHNPKTIRDSDSYMEPKTSALYKSNERIGRNIDKHLKVFHIETALNNRMFGGPTDFLAKKEEDYTEADRLKFQAMRFALSKVPRAAARKVLNSIPAPYDVTGVYAGATEPTHAKTLETSYKQYVVPVEGQSDIVIFPIPFISPYSVNSILNPLLVQVMGLGYFYNLNRGVPLVKKGGVLILLHPAYDEFDPEHHPSYIEFFHRLLPETRDSMKLEHKYEREFAENPSYVHLYRKGNAYHGVHPFYMWYWGENGRQHVGKVIVAGAENNHVPALMGWERTDTLTEAIEEARGFMGRSATISLLRIAPTVMVDVK
ncbi:Transcriptional regulator [Myxococcus hansupus]|uniref:Transcriptional regulator n=1 Tax=Pseudomyxococcus hansupus TaxID=1297742 RepID=A0A0H4WYP3_9BACT|nr:lactate racemase domain-containing protein [Myxococcus hansupus]AKQ68541.1 Transcriptional regulator [Myxococcus hansupus]